jgi:hypothetical protein
MVMLSVSKPGLKQSYVRFERPRIIAQRQQLPVTHIHKECSVILAPDRVSASAADIIRPLGAAIRLPRERVRLERVLRDISPASPGGDERAETPTRCPPTSRRS